MSFRPLLISAMLIVASSLFAQSGWYMHRDIGATSGEGYSNPYGYIQLQLGGTGITPSSNVDSGGSIGLGRGNSPSLGTGGYPGGGAHESDSGDTNFQDINSFALETYGQQSMGFVVVVTFSDGQSITVGAWPTITAKTVYNGHTETYYTVYEGGPGRPPSYDTVYYYPEITNAFLSNRKRSFTVQYYFYWDYTSSREWLGDGPFTYYFHYTPDTTPPAVGESSAPAVGKVASHTWSFSVSDAPGVAYVDCQPQYSPDNRTFTNYGSATRFDKGNQTSGVVQPTVNLTGAADGYYRMLVTATSSNGYSSPQFPSSTYCYDTTSPQFSSPPTATFTPDGKIVVSWGSVSDSLSGLATTPIGVTYQVNGGTLTPIVTGGAATSTSAALDFNSTYYGSTIAFTVSAADVAGNSSSLTASVTLPPQLTMSVSLGSGSDDQNMLVDLQFNLTPQALKSGFTSIQIPRTLVTSSDAPATLSSLSVSTASITVDGSGNFVPSGGWTVDAGGLAHYVDTIPVSSGAGHKTWKYAPLPSPWIGSLPDPSTVVLPNHQGTVTLTLQDTSGNFYDPSNPTAFQLGSDRKARFVFQGSDPDRDHWVYEIDRVTQVKASSATLTGYTRISGNTTTDYPYSTGYAALPTLAAFPLGVSNYEALWAEGDAGPFHSIPISITVTPTPGGYQIVMSTVDGDLPVDSTGLTTRPGEDLTFSLTTPPNLTYSWDFGDTGSAGNVSQVQHTYHQAPGQTTDSTQYPLSVAISDGTSTQTVSLPVTVLDTQEGTLYESETWHGDHTVTGIVEVPANLTLAIVPGVSGTSAVTMSGGLGSGYLQGILIDSAATLSITDSISFAANSTQGWGTIEVLGTASIGAADIQGADRAIAVGPGASVTLTGTRLHDNVIGLHLAGTSTTAVNSAIITSNRVYGIKEDSGGRPLLSGTSVTQNFRNYYSFDQGLLTIGQINALNAQAATPNTGDANKGTAQ